MGEGTGPHAQPGAPDRAEPVRARAMALHLLCRLGWSFLPTPACLALRGGTHDVLLAPRLVEVLQTRRFDYKGQPYPLSPAGIDQIVRQLSAPGLAEGLLPANEQLYQTLTLGITITELMPDGKRHQPTIALIDWHDPAANRWDVTEAMALFPAQGTQARAPDLVCFVNGIPLAVIEAGATVDEGIGRHLRHQRQDEVPQLFAHAQLLVAVSRTQGRYGTTGTPAGGWARWCEQEFTDAQVAEWKNRPLRAAALEALFAGQPARVRHRLGRRTQALRPTEQDRLLAGLLQPARLLEFLRVFVLFDRKAGKVVARHPQFFATRALVACLNERRPDGGREGGIVRQASGSGGGVTMAFVAKALVWHHGLAACRVVVVSDRTDLEDRLARNCRGSGIFGPATAVHGGDEKPRAGTGRELARRIGQGTERIVFTPGRKFDPALRLPGCHNPSAELVVLVDDGWWRPGRHGSPLHERLRRALPHAACVAFTGTPWLQEETAAQPFGPVLHAYPMQHAIEEGVVLPLLYEERGPPEGAAGRIEWIAQDIATHFSQHVKPLGRGLKGLVATASKLDAIRYQRVLDDSGLVSSAVLISAPGRREGQPDEDEGTRPGLRTWWEANVERQRDAYELRVLGGFASGGDPDLLIVVDRLFTGVAEARNAVLYIDKPLTDPLLMQAIACVNRPHEAKRHGVLVDYRGALRELASRAEGGCEPADIDKLFRPFSAEYRRLPRLHRALWAFFAESQGRHDLEACCQVLRLGDAGQAQGRPTLREDFFAALSRFDQCLQTALSSRSFAEDRGFPAAEVARYREDLGFFSRLRDRVCEDVPEAVAYSTHAEPVGQQVREPGGVYQVPSAGRGNGLGLGHEHTYVGIFRRVAGEPVFSAMPTRQWADEASVVDRVVQQAVLEHSLSPHDIEAAIRKALLPRLFGLMGLERAKAAIDQVIQAAARRADDRVTDPR